MIVAVPSLVTCASSSTSSASGSRWRESSGGWGSRAPGAGRSRRNPGDASESEKMSESFGEVTVAGPENSLSVLRMRLAGYAPGAPRRSRGSAAGTLPAPRDLGLASQSSTLMLYSSISVISPSRTTYFCAHSLRNGFPVALTVPDSKPITTTVSFSVTNSRG